MKKYIFTVLIAIVAVPCFSGTPRYYVTAGVANPMAPEFMNANYLSGAHVGVMVGYPVMTRLECVADIAYNSGIFDSREFRTTLPAEDNENYIITGKNIIFFSAMIKSKFMVSSPEEQKYFSYLFAGAGLFRSRTGGVDWMYTGSESAGADGRIGTRSRIAPGITFGLGIEFKVESTRILAEVGALTGFTDEESTVLIPLRVGLAF
ncbi:hypothetical protein JW948_13935 [bacterium]|nr:hypothetical protein [bacterium]